ncbi:hypothetical protein PoB_001429000 [Plakobranchus ocellatus]|uniref:Uncharacterized protein n=1 Tax=Plakobranchus ocellatus TaxID=259542 RepID=A0AAV3YX43_9GAST|nr:hypothetical protein PoB_001429000 [Plakobranchus ocellatus]
MYWMLRRLMVVDAKDCVAVTILYQTSNKPDNSRKKTGFVVHAATFSRNYAWLCGGTPLFPTSNITTVLPPGSSTQRTAPMPRQDENRSRLGVFLYQRY